jgi:conjugal transfer pilus assembly protein TraF
MRYFYLYFSCLIIALTSISSIGAALDGQNIDKPAYTKPQKTGFYWYDDQTVKPPKEITNEYIDIPPQNMQTETEIQTKLTYNQLWVMHPDTFAKELDSRQKLAIQFPNVENVYSYLEVQDVAKRKSVAFAGVMGYVSQLNPQFNGEDSYPLNVPGQNIYRSEKKSEEDDYLNNVKEEFALLVFNSEGCKYCEAQDPILDMFYASHGWNIKKIDINKYSEIASKYSITQTPSIILISRDTGKGFPLTSGLITLPELKERIFRSVRMLKGEIEPEQW